MQNYPSWRYHHKKPAKLVENEAEDNGLTPVADGWTDEPYSEAEKSAGKKLPKPEPNEEDELLRPPSKDKPVKTREAYPSWRYHKTRPAIIVQNEQDDARLSPGEWKHEPWPDNHPTDEERPNPAAAAPAPSEEKIDDGNAETPAEKRTREAREKREEKAKLAADKKAAKKSR